MLSFHGVVSQEDQRPTSNNFHFKAKWLQSDEFDTVMKDIWEESDLMGMGQWDVSIQMCGEKLREWDAKVYKKVPGRTNWLKRRL